MLSLVIVLIATGVIAALARAARRFAVVDRLERRRARAPRIPSCVVRRLEPALDAAALDLDARTAMQAWMTAVTVAAILGLTMGGSLAAAGAASMAAALGVPGALYAARGRRARQVAAAVPAVVDDVAAELRAGGTIATGVARIAAAGGPLASDFARIDARTRLGASTPDALRAWAAERAATGVDAAAGALALCVLLGGRAADALEGLASSLRDRLAVIAEARALSAQARLSALVVGGAPLLYLAWSAIVDPRAVRALTSTPAGRLCVLLGLALELIGALWMRRILRNGSGS